MIHEDEDLFTEDLFDLDDKDVLAIREDLHLTLKSMHQTLSSSPVPYQEIFDAVGIRFLKAFVSEWKLDIDESVSKVYESSMVYNFTTPETIPLILTAIIQGFESREYGYTKLKQYIHCQDKLPMYHRYLAMAYENIW